MRKSQLKPWLNEDGSIKNDVELREALQQCPPSVWREYLTTLEGGRKEELAPNPYTINDVSTEECVDVMFSMAGEEKHHLLKTSLNACIRKLPPKQRQAIISYYWDGKTITEIAAHMGVSKQAVSKNMKAALAKLRVNLINGALQKRVIAARETARILGLTQGLTTG